MSEEPKYGNDRLGQSLEENRENGGDKNIFNPWEPKILEKMLMLGDKLDIFSNIPQEN